MKNESWKNVNSPGKVLEFCFPISVRTLRGLSAMTIVAKIKA